MADDIPILDSTAATRQVATDDIGGRNFQIIKLAVGVDGSVTLVDANGFPTAAASFAPGYDGPSPTPNRFNVDDAGGLLSRSTVLTDEGTFRVNFANSALAVSIPGTPARTGNIVSGLNLLAFDLHVGDYFKFDSDTESSWKQITGIIDTTSIEVLGYAGATSGAASRALVKPFTGAGGSMSVASGQLTLNSGTTTSVRTGVLRTVDYAPLVYRARLSLSQRVVNQDFHAGLAEDESLTARWFARFRFTGTTNTTVRCETGRNPTTTPSASETQFTDVTIGATSTAQEYRIELLSEAVRFYVGGLLVAEHTLVIPAQHDEMVGLAKWENTGVPVTSAAVIDYATVKNHNKVETSIFSDSDLINVRPMAGPVMTYDFTGVVAINTTLLQLDCQQYQGLSVHCHNIGTTGVITPEWSANNVNWTTATVTTPAGADSTTLANTTQYLFPRAARYFRLRMSTATTALQTLVYLQGLPFAPSTRLATQPVNGTVVIGATVTPGTAATNLGKAEDAVSASGDTGVFILGVRRDAALISASATGDYNEVATNRFGAILTSDFRQTARGFRAITAAFATVALATDIWDLFGNATTTVVVTRIRVWATQTTAGTLSLTARLRTTATTPGAGRSVAATIVKFEQADTITSTAPGGYTALPTTIGTDAGAIAGGMVLVGSPTSGPGFWEFVFGDRTKPVILSGVAQGIAINLGGVTVTGGSFIVEVEAYEF